MSRSHEEDRRSHKHSKSRHDRDESGHREHHKHREHREHRDHKHKRHREHSPHNEDNRHHHKRKFEIKQEKETEDHGSPPPVAHANNSQNFEKSGKLAEDTNMFNGILVKYSEPPEARKPKRRWRLYPFKGDQALPVLHIHRQSAFLMGRERKVCDIPIDHPSCSKQHAALQYRLVPHTREDGRKVQRIRLYIIDLESANGTFINNNKIPPKKYVELLEKDVIKFGFSSREYVLLHEHSKDEEEDDDM